MNAEVTYQCDRASAAEIAAHLASCDADFMPPLSGRVDLDSYAAKLADKAQRFEAWAGGSLVGLVAVYFSTAGEAAGHVSNVSVLKAWSGRGIAAALLNQCLAQARSGEIARLTLEVAEANAAAVSLYRKAGFAATGHNGIFTVMTAVLNQNHLYE